MIYVTEAHYVNDYKIHLAFNDHKEGTVDLKDVINNDHRAIFTDLVDLKKFKQFKVDMDTIIWENGLDLAPEFLYARLIPTKIS